MHELIATIALAAAWPRWQDYNPASHAIWYVAGLLFFVLGVILLVEIWDWCRAQLARWLRKGEAEAISFPSAGGRVGPADLGEPSSELRRRHFRRPSGLQGAFERSSPNHPADRLD